MRIAFLTTEYVSEPSYDGGLANYLHRVALSLLQRGHHIEIFTQAEISESIDHDGIHIHRIKPSQRVIRIIKYFTHCSTQTAQMLVMAWQFRKSLLQRHRHAKFDIVQASSHRATGLGLVLFSPIPVTIRVSSYEPLLYKASNGVEQKLTRDQKFIARAVKFTLFHSQGVYSPSQFLAKVMQSDLGIAVQVIRPPFFNEIVAMDSSLFEEILRGKQYILFFGTLNRLKGGLILADAAAMVLARYPELHLVLAGKIGKLSRTVTMLDHLLECAGASRERVLYLGRLSHAKLYPVIKNATCVVLPSLVDNLPNALLESMALGRPVIGTNGTSFEELIEEGVTGFLARPGDIDDLSSAIDSVLKMNVEKRLKIGEAARERVELEYSPDTTCSQLEQYFQRHLDK